MVLDTFLDSQRDRNKTQEADVISRYIVQEECPQPAEKYQCADAEILTDNNGAYFPFGIGLGEKEGVDKNIVDIGTSICDNTCNNRFDHRFLVCLSLQLVRKKGFDLLLIGFDTALDKVRFTAAATVQSTR